KRPSTVNGLKPIRSTLAAAILATLAACAVGPGFRRPDLKVPEHYASDAQRIAPSAGDSTTTGTGAPPASRAGVAAIAPLPDADADFWQRFDDSVLNELVDAALRENHDLRIALARF